ncbi:ABC transporter [Kwoniella heveanensis BCC8398]|uniref:ABC transporter n=1 Tax=Kwoniella heveanensis BCC8398 TaxID=1296120 RepID=A0A1B9GML3_9TREE|nr:ABC transporter [Kwoniella heveanensis BCC8398]
MVDREDEDNQTSEGATEIAATTADSASPGVPILGVPITSGSGSSSHTPRHQEIEQAEAYGSLGESQDNGGKTSGREVSDVSCSLVEKDEEPGRKMFGRSMADGVEEILAGPSMSRQPAPVSEHITCPTQIKPAASLDISRDLGPESYRAVGNEDRALHQGRLTSHGYLADTGDSHQNETISEKARNGHQEIHAISSRRDMSEKHTSPQDRSALLNLPPPLPYHLAVEGLSIGIPESKANKWIPNFLSKNNKRKNVESADLEKPKKKKWILKDVGCECRSGEVLAILGGSGSGKTTLLNAIASRLGGLPIESGEVAYYAATKSKGTGRGKKLSRGEMKRRIGFVRQQDYLVECLTVRETLTYAARLRLPTSLSDQTVALIVEQTIDELGLRDAANTVVGGPLRKGISGGEKRRLSIGCVLVTLPSVLILDEPTSGLDAFTSYLLLLTLSHLARRGRTIILSIHAPRSDAFDIFDRIALLTKGEIVYSGLRSDCLGWFKGLGHEVEKGVNPLDFLIDVSSVDNRTPEAEEISLERVRVLVNAWNTRSPSRWADNLSKQSIESSRNSSSSPVAAVDGEAPQENDAAIIFDAKDEKRPGLWKQTLVLTARAHRNVYRNSPQLIGFVVQAIVLGVIIGLTYFRLPETPTGIQSLKNLSFQLIPGVFYLQQVFWVYKFCTDLVIFDREREDVIPYVVSDFISFLLPSILSPTIYVVAVYFIAKLRTEDLAARLFTSIASTILVQLCTQGMSLLSAALLRSFAAASMMGNALNLFMIVSSGFIVTHVPPYVAWIRWISPYFYSFRELPDRKFDCPADSAANLEQCDGNNVLNGLRFNASINIGAWFGGLIGITICAYAIACFILWIYPAGGVKHASVIESNNRGKQTDVMESHMTRDKINVTVRNVTLHWQRKGRGAMKDQTKTILNDVSVSFPAGEISAILGPSGAGKSTLLQLIAGRSLNPGPLARFTHSGQLLFADQPISNTTLSNVAFVEQDDDWHLPSLTVRETLTYAAILRLPDKMPRRQKSARAETVLRMLGLKDCADLPVGGQLLKGISGGEKRRLSLAVQMINDPAVLVVDEPTSGLDASIALSVMQVLKDIAATGRTVIATIHQPRSDIWKLADNVTLLAKGGVVAFTGKRSEAVEYFSAIGHPMPSEFFNPADHLLDLVSVDPRLQQHEASRTRVQALTSKWQANEAGGGDEGEKGRPTTAVIGRGAGTTSMIVALPVVLERHWKNLWRRKDVFFNRLVQTPLLGGLFILFFQRLSHGPSGAQDRIGVTIESTSAIAFVGLLNAMAIFPADRNLYLHEAKSSARYSPATFIVTYTLVELGFELLGGFGYAAIMNVAVGMQTSVRIYFEFAISIWAMVNMGESFAIMFGSWIQTEGLTVTSVSTLLSVIGQVSGVISLSVPNWLAGLAWGTCVKAATRIQIINEAVGLKFNCTEEEISSGSCVAQNGEQLLALFGWNDLNTAKFMGILIGVAVAWRIMAWLSLAAKVGGIR